MARARGPIRPIFYPTAGNYEYRTTREIARANDATRHPVAASELAKAQGRADPFSAGQVWHGSRTDNLGHELVVVALEGLPLGMIALEVMTGVTGPKRVGEIVAMSPEDLMRRHRLA